MSDRKPPACRFVASDQPRAIKRQHLANCTVDVQGPLRPDETLGQCEGCEPCRERHCLTCGKRHAEVTCVDCVKDAREDLAEILSLCGYPLIEEVLLSGADGEAAMLLGPAANPESWWHRHDDAKAGRIDASYLEDCHGEQHPLWVLGTWESLWRDHLEQPSDLRQRISRAGAYIGTHLTHMAQQLEPPFEQFAKDLRGCRAHLEDVLSAGEREEKGAPCVQCQKPMVRVTDKAKGAQDAYRCHGCSRTVSGDQYRYAVAVAHLAHADRLTAEQLERKLGIKASVIRVWGSRGHVRKRGLDDDGVTLYDVAQVEARHAGVQDSA